jgi:hypothetical protein
MTSPPHPSAVQRELVEPIDPDNLVDIPRDIRVGRKRLAWAHPTPQEAEGHAYPIVLSKRARDHRDIWDMLQLLATSLILEPSCCEEASN